MFLGDLRAKSDQISNLDGHKPVSELSNLPSVFYMGQLTWAQDGHDMGTEPWAQDFQQEKGPEKRNVFRALCLVAGAGFEPTTFGL